MSSFLLFGKCRILIVGDTRSIALALGAFNCRISCRKCSIHCVKSARNLRRLGCRVNCSLCSFNSSSCSSIVFCCSFLLLISQCTVCCIKIPLHVVKLRLCVIFSLSFIFIVLLLCSFESIANLRCSSIRALLQLLSQSCKSLVLSRSSMKQLIQSSIFSVIWIRRISISTLTMVEEHKRCFLCFFLNALKLTEFLGFINNAIHAVFAINASCFIDLILKSILFIFTQIRELADNILSSFFSSIKFLLVLSVSTTLIAAYFTLNLRIIRS